MTALANFLLFLSLVAFATTPAHAARTIDIKLIQDDKRPGSPVTAATVWVNQALRET